MKLDISDVNVGEYDVETGKTVKFKVTNNNDATCSIESWKSEDPRNKLTIPSNIKPFQTVTAVLRIPLVDSPVPDDLDEIEDLVRMEVKFLR